MTTQLSILDAIEARNTVMTDIHDHADDQDRAVVKQAILTVAARRRPFSQNAVRDLLPTLRSNNIVGPCYGALARAGQIRRVEGQYEPSTDPATHGHPIAVWLTTDLEENTA